MNRDCARRASRCKEKTRVIGRHAGVEFKSKIALKNNRKTSKFLRWKIDVHRFGLSMDWPTVIVKPYGNCNMHFLDQSPSVAQRINQGTVEIAERLAKYEPMLDKASNLQQRFRALP